MSKSRRFKEFSELCITDDFMFCQVMQNEKICRKILSLTLGKEIGSIRELRYQDVRTSAYYNSRSVRLDVTAGDNEGTFYDIEMQTSFNRNLARRLRYYQSITDTDLLRKNHDYAELPESIIIMLCTFDYFGKGRPVYSFRYICEEDKEIALHDGTLKVFVNSRAADREKDPELRAFLRLMNGVETNDTFVKAVVNEIKEIKNDSAREAVYMSYWKEQADLMDMRREAIVLGEKRGEKQGEDRLSRLFRILMDEGRLEDMKKVTEDESFRASLYRYYGLN